MFTDDVRRNPVGSCADPILVVGAGPTGLLLAAELARHGAAVRIVEKHAQGGRESRALGLHCRTLEMLDGLGLAEEFIERGHQVRALSLYAGSRLLTSIDFRLLDSTFRFMLDIPQDETERLLREHLARLGVHVEYSTEVARVTQALDRVEVTVKRPDGLTEAIRAPYVVGCDGAHSKVRSEQGMTFEGHGYPQDWLLADVALDWDRSPDEMHAIFHPSGRPAVCMPMKGGRWRVTLPMAGERGGERRPPSLAEIAGLLSQRVPDPVAVSDPTWLATFRTHRRSASGYRRGRVFLAGDAVHIHSPAGGQGMNTGLLDAHNLAWKLAAVVQARVAESLLATYELERAPVARDVLGLTHNLVRLGTLSAPLQRAARAVALPVATRLPTVRSRAARRVSQLYVDYRSSPLTEPARGSGSRGLRPGDRAPDAAGLSLRGQPVRLHQLLRGTHHTLLLLGGASPDAARAAREVAERMGRYGPRVRLLLIVRGGAGAPDMDGTNAIRDVEGEAHRTYGTGGAAHLVRPDGYLAASGYEAIAAYLERVYPLPGGAREPDLAGWPLSSAGAPGGAGNPIGA